MIVLVTEALGNSDSVGVMHLTKDKADYSDVRILTLTLARKLDIAVNHTNIGKNYKLFVCFGHLKQGPRVNCPARQSCSAD